MRNQWPTILIAIVVLAAPGRAEATNTLYDFNRFFQAPHPFAVPTAAQPQQPQPAATPRPAKTTSGSEIQVAESDGAFLGGVFRNFYATANVTGGYSWMRNHEFVNGTGLQERRDEDWVAGNTISVGYDWAHLGAPIRTELEVLTRYRFDLDFRGTAGGNLQGYMNEVATLGGMLNAFYDFKFKKKWRPYVGGGVGIARHWSQARRTNLGAANADDSVISQDTRTNNFAWALMGGFVYNWNPDWGVRVEGRYTDLGEVVNGPFGDADTITSDYDALDLLIGITYGL